MSRSATRRPTGAGQETGTPELRQLRSASAQLGIAVLAISSSAILVRWTELPALTLAWWRTLLGGLLLVALSRRRPDASTQARLGVNAPSNALVPVLVAGVALAVHFWAWLASLDRTSVAASTTLVAIAPFLLALDQVRRGEAVGRRSWAAIAGAVAGVAIIVGAAGTMTDPADSARHLQGAALALLGAVAMAVYLGAGERLRRHHQMSTAQHGSMVYLVAAVALGAGAAITATPLWAFLRPWSGRDVAVIAAMVLGPQLLGHTTLNHLLPRLGRLTVSFALLAEPVGATLLGLIVLGEVPSLVTVFGAVLVIGSLAVRLMATVAPSPRPELTAESAG